MRARLKEQAKRTQLKLRRNSSNLMALKSAKDEAQLWECHWPMHHRPPPLSDLSCAALHRKPSLL